MGEPLHVAFASGLSGTWQIDSVTAVVGEGLPEAARLAVVEGWNSEIPPAAVWVVRGVTSHDRYVTRREHDLLAARQPSLGRADASRAALIPLRKSPAWWSLPQDERRSIFEERSHHVGVALEYLPAVARRLHHSRELGEPFDFLTWFEYAPRDAERFDELLRRLRATEEWDYVQREVDIRLAR